MKEKEKKAFILIYYNITKKNNIKYYLEMNKENKLC